MPMNTYLNRSTPGVYVTEIDTFSSSIVGVATAVPIFIGYTETAIDPVTEKPLYLQAVPLSTMADYISYFGNGFNTKGIVEATTSANYDFEAASLVLNPSESIPTSINRNYCVGTSSIKVMNNTGSTSIRNIPHFNLYAAMQLFFANGGGNCYVVSVNNYWGKQSITPTPTADPVAIKADDLMQGLQVSSYVIGPTILVAPDICLLPPVKDSSGNLSYPDYATVVVEMATQAATLQDRVAILDLPGAMDSNNWSAEAMATEATVFYNAIGPAVSYLSYGAAYGPALQSSLLSNSDILYSNFYGTADSITLLNHLLTSQAYMLYPSLGLNFSSQFQEVAAHIAAAFPPTGAPVTFGTPVGIAATITSAASTAAVLVSLPNAAIYALPTNNNPANVQALNQYLSNAVPLFKQIQQILANQLNVAPASGIMAGVWAQNDANRGVWNAPANIGLNRVATPKILLTDNEQSNFNVPINGEAINILRYFTHRGTVVWGARTLDGNSLDFRYIHVRRTLIYIEQSIKTALQQFTFSANDGMTWVNVSNMISNFLTQLWQLGGLMGNKPSSAFSVKCGLGSTMTSADILNGYMIVAVTVQLIHPAEFIELTFTQEMQGT